LGSVSPAARAAEPGKNLVPLEYFATSDKALEVTLWAATPQLHNPTNLDIDKDGRIWVAEGVNYRRHYERKPEGDRIVVLEVTDGDGKADKSSVFVQEPFLRAPMGVSVIDNRVVVAMAPDLLVYTDVDRDRRFDPKVDRREVLLHGFNGRVHDHTIHSVTVGPDGQWYWNAGNSGALFTDKSKKTFRVGSPYDPYYGRRPPGDLGWDPRDLAGQKSDDGHVYVGGFAARMKPDGSGVHIIGHNFRNSYEQAITSFGDVFHSDNDDPPACRTSFLLEFGNAGFASNDGRRTWSADRRPGQSIPTAEWRQEDPGTMPSGDVYGGGSPTGMVFVEDSALGRKYRGLLLSGEPGRNVVFGYFPRPDGAGWKLDRFDFVTSNRAGRFAGSDYKGGDKAVSSDIETYFRPSDVALGPDGAVYIADFYDPRVGGHNDMDETLSGAIYRVAPKGFRSRPPKVDLGTVPGAVAALKSPAVNVRGAAVAALQAAGAEALGPLSALLRDENPYVRARAVWLLAGKGADGKKRVEPLLRDKDAQVRVVALRALRRQLEEAGDTAGLVALVGKRLLDPSPAVRRELALALRDVPLAEAKEALVQLARGFEARAAGVYDRTYLEAWGTGATGKEAELYAALVPVLGKPDPLAWSPAFERLAWRLHPPDAVAAWRQRALAASVPESLRKAALAAIAMNGTQAAADAMLEVAGKSDKGVKAEAMWWLLNRKDGAWKPFGVGTALKQRGLYDPEKIELVAAPLPALAPSTLTTKEVLGLKGDVGRGSKVIAACLTCHKLGEDGTDYAPNLTGWTRGQSREALALSIVNPSADIAHGFGGQLITTTDGLEINGRVLAEGDPLIVQSQGGVTQTVPSARIKSRKPLLRSLMLGAEEVGLEAQSVADVMAYLESRKD
jgi:putative membrane-bound dehydrogenase-like protein